MQDLNKLREELKRTAEALKEKKKQEKAIRQKIRKLRTFKKKKLTKLCIHFLAGELEPVAKIMQELKDLQEVIDNNTTEGKAMLKILKNMETREKGTSTP